MPCSRKVDWLLPGVGNNVLAGESYFSSTTASYFLLFIRLLEGRSSVFFFSVSLVLAQGWYIVSVNVHK